MEGICTSSSLLTLYIITTLIIIIITVIRIQPNNRWGNTLVYFHSSNPQIQAVNEPL